MPAVQSTHKKKLEKYVDVPSALGELDFALPPCPKCGEKRVNETQNFVLTVALN